MNIELKVEEGAIIGQSSEAVAESTTSDAFIVTKTARECVAEAFSSLVNPTTTTLPSSFEIIQKLSIVLKQQTRQRSYLIILLGLLVMLIGIIFFIILRYISNELFYFICIMFGVFLIATSHSTLVLGIRMLCIHSERPVLVSQGSIRYVMRIEGDQWKRFLTYFYSSRGRPSRFRGWWFFCTRNGKRYRQLLMRNYGYIVLTSNGFMVDELFCTTYNRHIVLNVELIPILGVKNENSNETVVDTVMRIVLCRRVYNSKWGPPTPFKIDIFLPSEIPSYDIPGIVKTVAFSHISTNLSDIL